MANTNEYAHKAVMHIEGMSCMHCVRSVENAFKAMGLHAEVSLENKQAVVYMNEKLPDEALLEAVRKLDFVPTMQ